MFFYLHVYMFTSSFRPHNEGSVVASRKRMPGPFCGRGHFFLFLLSLAQKISAARFFLSWVNNVCVVVVAVVVWAVGPSPSFSDKKKPPSA
jgi:uncharacterized membrane protein